MDRRSSHIIQVAVLRPTRLLLTAASVCDCVPQALVCWWRSPWSIGSHMKATMPFSAISAHIGP